MTQAGFERSQAVQPLDVNVADQAPVTAGRCEDCACPAPAVTKVLGVDALTAANVAPNVVAAAAGREVGAVSLRFALTEASEAA